jgi:hypothetical protein
MGSKLYLNERAKMFATLFNNLAVASVSGGFILPVLTSILYSNDPARAPNYGAGFLLVIGAGCIGGLVCAGISQLALLDLTE